jgi:hypothetical protein
MGVTVNIGLDEGATVDMGALAQGRREAWEWRVNKELWRDDGMLMGRAFTAVNSTAA